MMIITMWGLCTMFHVFMESEFLSYKIVVVKKKEKIRVS